jgi:hypothetical protein
VGVESEPHGQLMAIDTRPRPKDLIILVGGRRNGLESKTGHRIRINGTTGLVEILQALS